MAQVEAAGPIVLRVHDDRGGRDLTRVQEDTPEGVEQKKLADALAAKTAVHRQPPEERRGDERIARQLPGGIRRKTGKIHGVRGQSVEAGNGCAIGRDDENGGDLLRGVLAGLLLQVTVERFNAAGELGTIVPFAKRLDAERRLAGVLGR